MANSDQKTQSGLALVEIGKPLRKTTLPIPEPKENEILLKVTVCGLIILDYGFRNIGSLDIGSRLPAIIGCDIVGEVISYGPGVDKSTFPIGSHVFSQIPWVGGAGGGLQEYTIIDARYTALVPKGISDDEAAVFPVNAFTDAIALFSPTIGLGIPFPGSPESASFNYGEQKLVIVGGGTQCGKLALQMAALAGIGTIITIAGKTGEAELKSFGAMHVIDRTLSDPEIEKSVRDIVGDDLQFVLDTYSRDSAQTLGASLLSNKKKGAMAALLPGTVDADVEAMKKGGFVKRPFFSGASSVHPEFAQVFWREFPKWLGERKIKALERNVVQGLDEEDVNRAIDEVGGRTGMRWHVRVSGGKNML